MKARTPLCTFVGMVMTVCAVAGAAHASSFYADARVSLEVPFNTPLSYTVYEGSATATPSLFYSSEGFAAVTLAQPGTSTLLLPGLLGTPLEATAGPISGFAFPVGVANAFSAIVSDSFAIQSLNQTDDQILRLGIAYDYTLVAQKLSAEPEEYANARVSIRFIDYVTGNFFEVTNPVTGEIEMAFVDEARRNPEDGPGITTAVCDPCVGFLQFTLPANGTVDIGIILDVQGNAVWAPAPSSAALFGVAAALATLVRWFRRGSVRS
jgi:hypothetical protein